MIHNTARLPLPALISPGAAGDLRSGKQLVGADGAIVTGTLPEVIQATPTISVSSGGLITASATQSGGIVEGGTKSSTKQLTTQGAKTVTPGTTAQTAVASGRYTTGAVQVAGDTNLLPENIAEGVSIFGVTGTHSGGEIVFEALETDNVSFQSGNLRITTTRPIKTLCGLFLRVVYPTSMFVVFPQYYLGTDFSRALAWDADPYGNLRPVRISISKNVLSLSGTDISTTPRLEVNMSAISYIPGD